MYLGLVAWSGTVCYSRYVQVPLSGITSHKTLFRLFRLYLTYHTTRQVLWGAGVGVIFGALTYTVLELIPYIYPGSSLGRFRRAVLSHPISTWLRIKDGWAIWSDGGREVEWLEWRAKWERKNITRSEKRE